MAEVKPGARIPDELAAFLESGLSLALGTRNADLAPNGTRAWAIQVAADRTHVTVFVEARSATPLLADLEAHPQAAVVFDRPSDSRACQIKGRFVDSRRARPAERAFVERQVDDFKADLEKIGVARALTAGWRSWPCVAVRILVTDLFHQTPGPGAGERMR
ncbi:MAG TPA: pyridoxamine 5'-phosphate oxidase family protein [Candidatus Polarisedimenticolaceae bacterium]|nr:pyridoxamine 5'-phosphate oxidase family protein [Candidatus Polarisedimenticolaceae bacterium]